MKESLKEGGHPAHYGLSIYTLSRSMKQQAGCRA